MKRHVIRAIAHAKEQIKYKEQALTTMKANVELLKTLHKGQELASASIGAFGENPPGKKWMEVDVIAEKGLFLKSGTDEDTQTAYVPWHLFIYNRWRIR